MDAGAVIRARREAASLTQEQLAKRAGVSRAALAKVEAGHAALGLHMALRLGRALGLSAGWLDDVPPGPVRRRSGV